MYLLTPKFQSKKLLTSKSADLIFIFVQELFLSLVG